MDVSELKREYAKKKNIIKNRLKEFLLVSGDNLFYEVCFCLLTPQSNAYKCDECISILKNKNFLYKNFEISNILKEKTRFYRNKSNYIIRFKETHKELLSGLSSVAENKDKREYLVKHVKGLGYKEASHFLRNTGHRDLAILDRHILKNLLKLKVIAEVPRSLTKKKYLEIEDKFAAFSKKINIPMDELDLLFWSMETGKVFK